MRRTSPALAVLALLLVTAPAHAEQVQPVPGTEAFTTVDARVPVVDGPNDDHETTIDTRLYLPKSATAATPQPAILMTHGFGLSKLSAEVVSTATFLARHGYVVLTYTAQGFGKSTGCVTLQSRTYDVKDARQLITKVLEARPEVKKDAKGAMVGMTGGSYGGGIQASVAQADPRVRAINPGRTWSTLRYSLNPNNYVAPGDPTGLSHDLNEQGVFKQQWTSLFFASGNSNPAGGIPPTGDPAGTCPQDKLASGDPTTVAGLPCLGFNTEVCRTYATVSATGNTTAEDRALLADASGATQIAKLTVPTLLFQGQADTLFNLNDATSTYLSLKRAGTPVQMVWNAGGHGGYNSRPGECDVYGGGTGGEGFRGLDDCYLSLRTLQFFDRWLKGKPDPSGGLGFTWFRDWVAYDGKGATNQYDGAASFPLPGTTTLTLSGTDALVETGATASTATIVNPPGGLPAAYTETSNFTGPSSTPQNPLPPTEIEGQHADFTSEPLDADLDVVGIPSLKVQLSHVAPTDLFLFAKAYDVAPDGSATLLRRLIAPARIPTAALAQPVEIKLAGFAHRFAKGHRIRLTLATTDLTSSNNKAPDVITIATGSQSTLTLQTAAQEQPNKPLPPGDDGGNDPVDTAARPLPATGLNGALPALGVVLALAAAARLRRTRRT